MEHEAEPPQSQAELLQTNRRRLRLLEKQAAHFGARADPALLMEIEDLRRSIARLERSLGISSQPTPNDLHPLPRHRPASTDTGQWWMNPRRLAAVVGSGIVLLAVVLMALSQFSRGNRTPILPAANAATGAPALARPTTAKPGAVSGTADAASGTSQAAPVTGGGTNAQAPIAPLTIAPPVNLTNSPGVSSAPRIVFDAQDNLHLTWTEDPPQKKADRLYQRMAPDRTWTKPEDLTSDYGDMKGSDQLLRAPDGTICMVWYGTQASNHPFTLALRKRCLGAGGWSPADAVYEGGLTTTGFATIFDRNGNVRALSFSTAYGIYLGNSQILTKGPSYTLAFAIDSNGQYHAAWNSGQGLQFASSTDGGQTWSKAEQITNEAYVFVPEVLVADGQGRLHLVWGTLGGSNIYYQRWSADTGWSTAIRLTKEFSSGKEPALAVDGEGRAHVVWSGENGIFYARQVSDDTFAEAVQVGEHGRTPAIALNTQNVPHFAWADAVGEQTDIFFTTAQ